MPFAGDWGANSWPMPEDAPIHIEELHRAQEQQQLAAAGGQQRTGSVGHERSLQDWTNWYSPEVSSKWTI